MAHSSDASTPGDRPIALTFAIMQLVGCIFIIIILGTSVFSKNIQRSFTWTSFCVAAIITCLSYDLLFFAGQQTGPPPNHTLCLVQSALVHTVPILQASANLALMVQTWAVIRYAIFQKMVFSHRSSLVILLGSPYILATSLFTGFFVFAIKNPSTVQRETTGVYCKIAYYGIPSRITAGMCGLLLFMSLIVEGVLGWLLVTHWHKLTKTGSHLTLIIRVMLFSFVGGVALGLTIVFVTASGNGPGADFLLAALPIVMSLIFGTQSDLLRVWSCWGPRGNPYMQTSVSDKSSQVSLV